LHELETLHEDNSKLYWKMINDLQDKRHDSEDNCISPSRWLKHFQSLNTVQEHFLPRIQQLKAKLESAESTICFNELDFPISESEITEAMSKIKLNKAPGLDNISNNMLKCSQTALLQCYKKIFNACLTNGIYPVIWTEGYITPLYKARETDNPNQGRIQDFKLGEAHLKKSRRAERGAKFVWVFRMKNHDFTQKNHIFSNFRGARAGCAPLDPPLQTTIEV